MDETCPVCGDPFEYLDDRLDASTVIEVEELCAVEDDRRWDRICVRSVEGTDGDGPVLEQYRHHWDDD